MGRLLFLLFTIILTIVAVVVATYNVNLTSVNLYIESYELPLSLKILYSFVAGIFTALIYLISVVLSYKKRNREMKIALQNNRQELDNLRRNPLRDGTE